VNGNGCAIICEIIPAFSRKDFENHEKSEDSRFPGRGSKPDPPKYKSEAMPLSLLIDELQRNKFTENVKVKYE
jgi:hypothetical protein